MGMAASQARYMSLVAKQSNLEYQGQQINNERSILSQQVSDLYNSLLMMEVPTPPSTSDFTTIEYRSMDSSFTLGSVKPQGDGNYTIEQKTTQTGGSLQKEYGKYKVESRTEENDTKYYIGGFEALTWTEASQKYGDEMSKYETAVTNTFGEDGDVKSADFYVFVDNTGPQEVLHFALMTRVSDNDGYTEAYTYGTGTFTASQSVKDCVLTFDTSGRITSIDIPVSYAEDGTPAKYQTVSMEAVSTKDNDAYQDAYAEYEYQQYLYDKEQAEINAKTEVIQQEDRNLELKLQRLDNERTQIKTELDALEKVIDDNIEKSYKTFSG